MTMRRSSVASILLRRLIWGLLIAFINGLSLPILFGLFVRLRTLLEEGKWLSGPVSVAELTVIFFVFGIACSLLPSVVGTMLLGLGIHSRWSGKKRKKWLSVCTGVALGVVVAVSYVLLLFRIEPIFSTKEYNPLAILILMEQVVIYGWLAYRWSLINPTGNS